MRLAFLIGGWPTFVAWLTACVCVCIAWSTSSRLERLRPPAPAQLLAALIESPEADSPEFDSPEFDSPVSERASRAAVAELNQRISDVAFELALVPARFAALTRINLASGTALALIAFLRDDAHLAIERVLHGGVCVVSGFVGAAVVASLGRLAKRRVVEIRQAWDRSSREIGKALGTPLA